MLGNLAGQQSDSESGFERDEIKTQPAPTLPITENPDLSVPPLDLSSLRDKIKRVILSVRAKGDVVYNEYKKLRIEAGQSLELSEEDKDRWVVKQDITLQHDDSSFSAIPKLEQEIDCFLADLDADGALRFRQACNEREQHWRKEIYELRDKACEMFDRSWSNPEECIPSIKALDQLLALAKFGGLSLDQYAKMSFLTLKQPIASSAGSKTGFSSDPNSTSSYHINDKTAEQLDEDESEDEEIRQLPIVLNFTEFVDMPPMMFGNQAFSPKMAMNWNSVGYERRSGLLLDSKLRAMERYLFGWIEAPSDAFVRILIHIFNKVWFKLKSSGKGKSRRDGAWNPKEEEREASLFNVSELWNPSELRRYAREKLSQTQHYGPTPFSLSVSRAYPKGRISSLGEVFRFFLLPIVSQEPTFRYLSIFRFRKQVVSSSMPISVISDVHIRSKAAMSYEMEMDPDALSQIRGFSPNVRENEEEDDNKKNKVISSIHGGSSACIPELRILRHVPWNQLESHIPDNIIFASNFDVLRIDLLSLVGIVSAVSAYVRNWYLVGSTGPVSPSSSLSSDSATYVPPNLLHNPSAMHVLFQISLVFAILRYFSRVYFTWQSTRSATKTMVLKNNLARTFCVDSAAVGWIAECAVREVAARRRWELMKACAENPGLLLRSIGDGDGGGGGDGDGDDNGQTDYEANANANANAMDDGGNKNRNSASAGNSNYDSSASSHVKDAAGLSNRIKQFWTWWSSDDEDP